MHSLLPPSDTGDPVRDYLEDDRHPVGSRPWVLVNMVVSVDGATAVEGRSGGLAGPADQALFHALRSVPDVVLAGAGTVRAETYRPIDLPADVRDARVERGQAPVPRLAVVTRSLDLDLAGPLFAGPGPAPIVITGTGSDQARRTEVTRAGGDLVLAGHSLDVDLGAALDTLAQMGTGVVLCEGGPSLNGDLVTGGLVDELCVSLSPLLVGGASARLAHGAHLGEPVPLSLRRVLEDDGMLFLRYTRPRETG